MAVQRTSGPFGRAQEEALIKAIQKAGYRVKASGKESIL